MAKYAYPAIITEEKDGFSVIFPDINGCTTSGKTLEEAISRAEDALCLMLYSMEEDRDVIPEASNANAFPSAENKFISLISCDTLDYSKY